MKQVVYETKGRAREFCELAVNLFSGCGHKCIYCYGADVIHIDKKEFDNIPRLRLESKDIEEDAKRLEKSGETRRVLLCFVTDPYQPAEGITQITRKTICALHAHGINVVILTKGGLRSTRDFDLLGSKDAYATTLTCDNEENSKYWEPGAAMPAERIAALKLAHEKGIETWVSFEPVIYPEQTINLLKVTKDFTGHYKVGTMNYHPHGKSINWHDFGWQMKRIMDDMGVKYYFKKDLLREMKVTDFKQTWTCF